MDVFLNAIATVAQSRTGATYLFSGALSENKENFAQSLLNIQYKECMQMMRGKAKLLLSLKRRVCSAVKTH
jgi:hypothetical protein